MINLVDRTCKCPFRICQSRDTDVTSLGNLTNITFIHIRHHPYIGQTGNRKQRIPLVGAQLHIPADLLFHS